MNTRLRLYYVPGTDLWVELPNPNEPITDPKEHFQRIDSAKKLKARLKERALAADGQTNDLPYIAEAPMVEERPFTTQVAGGVSISFPVYCGDVHLTSTPALVPYPELERAEGIMWLEKLPAKLAEHDPPQENVEKGYQCQTCRRFDYQAGQDWLSRETHQFQEGPEAMNRDIVRLAAEGTSNATMPKLEDMGYCANRKAMVPKTFPGCAEYVEKKSWQG